MIFDFSTPSGQYKVDLSSTSITPYGGLVAFVAFLNEIGFLKELSEAFPIVRTSNNTLPVYDVLTGFLLICLL